MWVFVKDCNFADEKNNNTKSKRGFRIFGVGNECIYRILRKGQYEWCSMAYIPVMVKKMQYLYVGGVTGNLKNKNGWKANKLKIK